MVYDFFSIPKGLNFLLSLLNNTEERKAKQRPTLEKIDMLKREIKRKENTLIKEPLSQFQSQYTNRSKSDLMDALTNRPCQRSASSPYTLGKLIENSHSIFNQLLFMFFTFARDN